MENIMKQEALNYAKQGIKVLVLSKQGQPVNGIDGTSQVAEIEERWRLKWNIGMPTGNRSSTLVVSFATRQAFIEAQVKGLPVTPMLTRGKGCDVYFKYSDGIEDRIDKGVISGMSLGEQPFAILPPSVVELHPASAMYQPEEYTWIEGRSITEVQLAEVPTWMLGADHQITTETEEVGVDVITAKVDQDRVEVDEPRTKDIVPDDLSTVNNPAELKDEWQTPKLFDRYHVDEIKAEVLPSWLGAYARAISKSKQTPEGLAVMLGLSMIATCVQKKFVVAPHGDDEYTEPLALWTLTALQSGERKSPVLNALREPLVAWQEEQAELLKDRILETSTAINTDRARIDKLHKDAAKEGDAAERQKILKEINEIKKAMPAEVKAPVLWTGDVTAEELQEMLVEHGERMSLLSDEGNIFAVMAGLYTNDKVNIDIFLQAYSGSPTRIDRRSRKAELKNPAMTFGIAVQPTVLQSFATGSKKSFRDKGALARFLYCIPDTMLGKRDSAQRASVPEEVKTRYNKGIKGLLSIHTPNTPKVLTLDDDAYNAWLAFDGDNEQMIASGGELEDMTDWGGKRPGNLLRIAGLMHLVEHGSRITVIGKATMDKAIQLCDLLTQHAKAAFAMAGAITPNANAKKIYDWMKERDFVTFTRTECHERFKSWKKEQLDVALADLIRRSIIKEEKELTAGRTATNYISNPTLK